MTVQPPASHHIGGAYVEDSAGTVIESIYPATGEVNARLHSATPAIVEQAVAAAKAAQPAWARLKGVERGRILLRTAEILRERNAEISRIETLDTGKAIQETLVADAASAADALEYFGGLAGAITGEHIDLGGDFVYTRREPLGICAGIGAWNYPIQIAAWKSAPALACGNAFIFKPSEMTPLTALKLAEAFADAGLPAGLFAVVQGYGDVGAALASHSGIAKVSLTGSVPTGAKVLAGAAQSIKSVTMELGGKSPILVFDDADIESAIGGAMLGNFYSTGQICSNGTRVFVQRGVYDRFLDRLKARTEAIRIGDPLDPDTHLGPMVSTAQRDKVLGYIEAGKREGARLLTGGGVPELQGFENGAWIQPTVFSDVTDKMTIAREEIFGPVMSVLAFDDEDEAVARANDTEFGLAAGVFTADLARAHRVISNLQAGTTWINTYNLTPVEAPFGGVKQSGIGRENGHAAIEHYTHLKSVYVATGPVDSPY
ncbi:MAG: betaine-aldehyde dehydrogenase [Hoeflea sp.]|uniref:betaine-aldehyde dehydrogenase n=1 Tax=Hoeflea sp. TaxID=1940281 RepID=UPI001DB17166|nr:betaine-aldehyde dehydrogenase [Hoeflea sp.]MBU4527888.1 betaine-aldehyde dehydrogenase [Alphaproteobacteria bacterium]MBU4546077.1 betaine-aldehyde dehydrogenase [Alphaproteobacteria bacterium]MBU4553238.1 betaine-aldehyde dehydrogenase [Alphaproteobacteria bacterium]MBV1724310.1 betaine-aldehyde dehydrogenase [Hoeflea sp.]MBV1759995.1 betaine-aldehyde dehydrogenase [Hoeflea sp.]